MTTLEFLSQLRRLHVKLWVEDDRLRFRAPQGVMTPELRAELANHKADILQFLREAQRAEEIQDTPIVPVPRQGPLPASFAQERLWQIDRTHPGSVVYNIPMPFRCLGRLDIAALQRSVDTLVQRHEALRTTFAAYPQGVAVDRPPVQVIAPTLTIPITVVDLQDLPEPERQARAMALSHAEDRRPFDLQRGPLLRVAVLRLAAEEQIVLLTIHHIIADGWSLSVLVRELFMLYEHYTRHPNAPIVLPEQPVQFADFAVWQRQRFERGDFQRQLAYWRQQLAGAPTRLELPTDRPRPPTLTFRGKDRLFWLTPDLSRALYALSRQEGATLFMTLLAAWTVLLSCYSGQHDLLVGTSVANRTRVEIEDVIGFVVNTPVLRADLSGNPSFRELIARLRETTLGMHAHQDLPFEALLAALKLEPDPSRTPLFQTLFVLQNTPMPEQKLTDVTLQQVLDIEVITSKYDLGLGIIEDPQQLWGTLEYRTDLFNESTICRMLDHFQTIVVAMVSDPTQPISDLSLPESNTPL
jgi:aspartate racemase